MIESPTPAVIARCRELGIGQCGLGSITNFVRTAYYHLSLPGTLKADRHLAFNSAVRAATGRIACQGRHGSAIWMSRIISEGANALRISLSPEQRLAWSAAVTLEHQDPVREVERWALAQGHPVRSVDQVVARLLEYPPVVVLRSEEAKILNHFRSAGRPEERYAGLIDVMTVSDSTATYFAIKAGRADRPYRGKYFDPFQAFLNEPFTGSAS